jgi:hypothetical protein
MKSGEKLEMALALSQKRHRLASMMHDSIDRKGRSMGEVPWLPHVE